ncbi:MAG TPA: hypothetical protein VIH61_05375, partial [Waddliaceae bacterium]
RVLNELKSGPTDARVVIDILRVKCEEKKAKNQNDSAFIRLVKLVCACVRNLFAGYGLRSTLELADNLIIELERVAASPEKPPQPKTKPPQPKIEENNQPKQTSANPNPGTASSSLTIKKSNQPKQTSVNPNPRIASSSSTFTEKKIEKALDSYSKDPENCPLELKKILFENVIRIIPDPTSSMEDLVRYTCGLEPKINLSIPICAQVVVDMFKFGDSGSRDKALAGWLSQEPTLDCALLNKCIDLFKNKPKDNSTFKKLLQISIDRGWDANDYARKLIDTSSEPSTPKKTPKANPPPENEKPNNTPEISKPTPKVLERFKYQPKEGTVPKPVLNLEGISSENISYDLKKVLPDYKKNPSKCCSRAKSFLFRNIKKISSTNTCSTMVGLVGRLRDLKEPIAKEPIAISLADPRSAQVVIDTLDLCDTGDLPDELAEWLSQNESFNSGLLNDCFKVIIRKNKEQTPISVNLLKKLLLTNWENDWNDETTSTAIALLFMRDPNFQENNVENLIMQIINGAYLRITTFLKWVAVFEYKEDDFIAEKGKNLSLHYPILEALIERSNQENWISELNSNSKGQKDALEFVLGYYSGHTKLGGMTAEKLLDKIAETMKKSPN